MPTPFDMLKTIKRDNFCPVAEGSNATTGFKFSDDTLGNVAACDPCMGHFWRLRLRHKYTRAGALHQTVKRHQSKYCTNKQRVTEDRNAGSGKIQRRDRRDPNV